jgi:hypothetical protein
LLILGVFKHLFNDQKQPRMTTLKERDREQREENLLIKCWSLLNPLARDTVDSNFLILFLKTVYFPYSEPNLPEAASLITKMIRMQAS